MKKICTKCHREKELDKFSKNKNYIDGFRYECKECVKENYQKNKVFIIARNKKWNKEHKTEVIKYLKQYRIDNKEKIKLQVKKYKDKHKDYLNQYSIKKRKNDISFRI